MTQARDFPVLHNGSDELPITDGMYYTGGMSRVLYETGIFSVAFYDSDGNIVTPTDGTIQPRGELEKGSFGAPGDGDTTIQASETGATFTYSTPVFTGPMQSGRITFASITGENIAYAKATFWRV